MKSPKIKVAILDDNATSRKYLRRLLKHEPDLWVVTEAGHGTAGIKEVEAHRPDVILMDANRPFTDNLEATQTIIAKFPDTRLIILSEDSKRMLTASSCHVGACYPLCRECSPHEILAAIRGPRFN